MDQWLSFLGRVMPMEWGKNVYTVLPLPEDIAMELERQGTRRVDIELNDHPFNVALTKAPVIPDTFVYAGKSVLREAGISPGEEIEVRLRRADPNLVDVPNDVMLAVRRANVVEAWASLTPGRQRGLLHQIDSAKKQETRARRIAQLVKTLAG